MAVLPTPSVNAIGVVDPSYSYTISFSYTGSQSTKNRAVITDNDTYKVVYDKSVTSLKLSHTIPKDTLQAGRQYLVQIQVFDTNGNNSNLSDSVLFYCFTAPSFRLNTIDNPHTSANITLTASYSQIEGETLKSYQYMLYNYSHQLMSTSDVLYGDITSYTFYGLNNETQYYVRCTATTTHGFSLDTGEIIVYVRYKTIPSNILFQLENHKCDGYISLATNLIDVGYDLANDNYTFNSDESVTLSNNSLTYNTGFNIQDDYALYIKATQLPINVFLNTQNNNLYLKVAEICDKYYFELKIENYVLYQECSSDEWKIDTLNKKISILDGYVIIEIKQIDGVYGLKFYYMKEEGT